MQLINRNTQEPIQIITSNRNDIIFSNVEIKRLLSTHSSVAVIDSKIRKIPIKNGKTISQHIKENFYSIKVEDIQTENIPELYRLKCTKILKDKILLELIIISDYYSDGQRSELKEVLEVTNLEKLKKYFRLKNEFYQFNKIFLSKEFKTTPELAIELFQNVIKEQEIINE